MAKAYRSWSNLRALLWIGTFSRCQSSSREPVRLGLWSLGRQCCRRLGRFQRNRRCQCCAWPCAILVVQRLFLRETLLVTHPLPGGSKPAIPRVLHGHLSNSMQITGDLTVKLIHALECPASPGWEHM